MTAVVGCGCSTPRLGTRPAVNLIHGFCFRWEQIVVTAVRDYLKKIARDSGGPPPPTSMPTGVPMIPMPVQHQTTERPPSTVRRRQADSGSYGGTYEGSQEWMRDSAARGLHDHDDFDRRGDSEYHD